MRFGPQNRFSLGDFSTDISQVGADFTGGNYSTAFSDPINGFPLWAWLAGAGFLYMFLFSGGEEHSRLGRARRAGRKGLSAARGAY
jgi:hypothetical protein